MPAKKYIVRLTDEERELLTAIVSKGKAPAYKIKHANILLKADANGAGWKDKNITEAFGCHRSTVENIRLCFVEQSLDAALERKKRETPPTEKIIDGEKEARLIALSRTQPPAGRAKWTLRLLADKMVELKIVDRVSHTTVGNVLKKTNLSPICGSAG